MVMYSVRKKMDRISRVQSLLRKEISNRQTYTIISKIAKQAVALPISPSNVYRAAQASRNIMEGDCYRSMAISDISWIGEIKTGRASD